MRLADWCHRHRWTVLVAWVLTLVGTNAVAGALGPEFSNSFSLPGTESQDAFDLLDNHFDDESGDTADLVWRADPTVFGDGVSDATVREALSSVIDELEGLDHVTRVDGPYGEASFGPPQISADGTIAYATVWFDTQVGDVPVSVIREALDVSDAGELDGLEVALGGMVVQAANQPEFGIAEGIGLLAAVFILLVAFGSLLAMGLPLLTAMMGIGTGMAAMTLMTYAVSTPEFAPSMASMIGIGVGIDYALFIVTRYREALRQGYEPEQASNLAMRTAGRAVLFAGMTVVVSMLGILLAGFEFVEGVAIGSALVVATVMLASITLLAAMLGFAGHNIDRLHVPLFHGTDRPVEETFWYRWSRVIQHHPLVAATIALVLLLSLAAPMLSMRLGVLDAGNDPPEYSTRQAYDLLAEGFGPGFNGPLLLVAELPEPGDLTAVQGVVEAVAADPGVAQVSPALPSPDGEAALVQVFPTTSPQDAATTDLVKRLRGEVLPAAAAGTGLDAKVGGLTAVFVDFSDKIAQRLPILIAAVIAFSFVLLMVVFRSLLVPLKAAVMNLLSVTAAYGVIVAVFQWGWGADLIADGRTGPIEAWIPMMMFAILFGLSMDYEVFLLSRVKEEYDRTGDNALAVANGLAHTARVISAAAAIMITVFLVFMVAGGFLQLKVFALGLAVAIFVDVTIVRMALVPSTMELLGDANWWLPKWLDRILPDISIEGAAGPPDRGTATGEVEPVD